MAALTKITSLTDTFVSAKTPTVANASSQRLYANNLSGFTDQAFIFFANPAPAKARILTARLHLFQGLATTAAHAVTVAPVSATWAAGTLTWNNKPAAGAGVAVSKSGNVAAGAEWVFDISAMFQSVSNGAAWFGLRLTSNLAGVQQWYHSVESPTVGLRPYVEIQWSDDPLPPADLVPSSGVVSTPAPTVSARFMDVSGDVTLAAVEVQVSTESLFPATAATWSSGRVDTTVCELNLATTTMTPLKEGETRYWRMRAMDGAGLWSAWSATGAFRYNAPTQVAVIAPAIAPIFRNLAPDPGLRTGTPFWHVTGVPSSRITGATDGPHPALTSYLRAESTPGVPVRTVPSIVYGSASQAEFPVVGGQLYSASMFVRWATTGLSASPQVRLVINFYDDMGREVPWLASPNWPTQSVPQGTWAWLNSSASAPSTATRATVSLVGVNFLPGRVDVTGLVITNNTRSPIGYFDGSLTATDQWTYAWEGAANASPSVARSLAVTDPTPTFRWLSTLGQSAYQIDILEMDAEGGNPTPKYSSGRVTGPVAANTYTNFIVPANVIVTPERKYRVVLKAWDNYPRVQTAGFPTFTEKTFDFWYTSDPTVDPASSLVAIQDHVLPFAELRWKRSTDPDSWVISRKTTNGPWVQLASVPGINLRSVSEYNADITYSWKDTAPLLRQPVLYRVDAVVNGITASGAPTIAFEERLMSTVLSRTDGTDPVILLNPANDITLSDSSQIFNRISNGPPVLLTQSARGFQGKVSGVLANLPGLTAVDQRDRFRRMAESKGATFTLISLDSTFRGFMVNPSWVTEPTSDGLIYRVQFDFYQTDYKPLA